MNTQKTFTGGCQCGAVRYEAKMDPKTATACNCSMCGKCGSLLTFIPEADFTLLSGQDSLTNYQFNKKHINHLFCKVCGIKSFANGAAADGSMMIAVNLRCIDDFDIKTLEIQEFDGKSL